MHTLMARRPSVSKSPPHAETFEGTLHDAVLWLIEHCRTWVGWRTRVELRIVKVDESRNV